MKALVYEGAWQMPLREIESPQPGPEDVIVSVQAVGVCGSDVHGYTGATGRRLPPMVMGHEFGGIVTALGERVTRARVGDRVVVQPLITCGQCANCRAGLPNICLNRTGLGMLNVNGAMAEAVRVPQQLLYPMPEGMAWEQAALVEPLAVALRAINQTPLTLMGTVVVIGAGTIGLLTVLAACLRGAGQVIVTDLSPHRLDLARQLGADRVVNVAQEDPAEVVQGLTDGQGAQAVIEAVGIAASVKQSLAVVRTGGHITWIGNSQPVVEVNMQQVVTRELTIRGTYGFNEEFGRALQAIHTGRLDVMPLIERTAPLEDGPQLFHDLARGTLDVAKVVLRP
jgi:2-desacetyl-2-hydroxyethyl bacteriochlorophyllide A dehydrogenase